MKKSKQKGSKHDVTHRPIVIPKATMDVLLELPVNVRGNAIALYNFYYYTAIWQETNKPYATSSYIKGGDGIERKGLGWGKSKIIAAKKALKSIPLIEDVRSRPKGEGAGSAYGKNYIQIIFYHSSEASLLAEEQSRTAELENQLKDTENRLKETKKRLKQAKNQLSGFQPSRKSTVLKTKRLNACSNNKGNACNNNIKNACKDNTVVKKTDDSECLIEGVEDKLNKNSPYYKRSIKLAKAVKSPKAKRLHPIQRKANISEWSKEFRKLHVKDKIEEDAIDYILDWYCLHIGEEHIPEAFCGESFRKKFPQIVSAMIRAGDFDREDCGQIDLEDDEDDFDEAQTVLPEPKTFKTSQGYEVTRTFKDMRDGEIRRKDVWFDSKGKRRAVGRDIDSDDDPYEFDDDDYEDREDDED